MSRRGTIAPYYPWVEVPDAVWDALAVHAQARADLHAAHDKRRWHHNSDLPGLAAEWCYGELIGLPPDLALRIRGDSGEDFPGVDVKGIASTYGSNVVVSPESKMRAPLYFAIVVDAERRLCKPQGYATREMVLDAPTRDFGYGEHHRVPFHELVTADELLSRLLAKGVR